MGRGSRPLPVLCQQDRTHFERMPKLVYQSAGSEYCHDAGTQRAVFLHYVRTLASKHPGSGTYLLQLSGHLDARYKALSETKEVARRVI